VLRGKSAGATKTSKNNVCGGCLIAPHLSQSGAFPLSIRLKQCA
jgi:hypothetical protein